MQRFFGHFFKYSAACALVLVVFLVTANTVYALSLSYTTSVTDVTDLTTYTFSSVDIGAAADDRLVIVSVHVESGVLGARTIQSASIGGNAASIAIEGTESGSGGVTTAIIYRRVTTGTTADISVTLSGSAVRMAIGVWRMTGQLTDAPQSATSTSAVSGTGLSVNVTVPANGGAIAAQTNGLEDTVMTWTGVTERYDMAVSPEFTHVSGGDHTTSARESGYTISTSHANSTQEIVLVAASWAGRGTVFTTPVTVTGNVNITGAVAKGSGTFAIDHPLDPKNKLLYHSFVESPDAKNLYDGIVGLDEKGEATIELPAYFLALNKDFRYLVTAIGEPMPNLFLKKEIKKRFFGFFGLPVFKISGGAPGGRVSWQVTGIRHDPYIEARPIIPEVEKGPDALFDVGEYVFDGYER